jgi:hypothetical protein
MAACGLDCRECGIHRATHNAEAARKIADSFRKEGFTDVRPEDVRCFGCKGDRVKHWSADCWLLKCCVDEKGFAFCYQCPSFPCDRLTEWAETDNRYKQALTRLKEMKRHEENAS